MVVASLKFALVFGVSVFAASCGSDGETSEPDMDIPDSSRPTPQPQRWSTSVVEGGNMGLHPRVALSANGVVAGAWVSTQGREAGPCTELGEDAPERVTYQIRYGEFDGTSWTIEDAAELAFVGQPPGIDFAFNGNEPLIAAMAGEPSVMFRYCGVNDAAVYERSGPGNWTANTAVAESGEAVTGDAASDFGTVVGYWPALAISSTGAIGLAHKDVHGGGLQSDDFRRADLEFALNQGGSWQPSAVDFGRGGGNFSDAVFDAQDRPVVVHYIPSEDNTGTLTGVWAHRLEGDEWVRVQLHNQPTSDGPSVALDPQTGTLWVAFYNAQRGFPVVAKLENSEGFTDTSEWEFEEIGDNRYDEGYGSSLAVSRTGIVGLAYYRCTRATQGLGECTAAEDELVFAYWDGFAWEQEVIDTDESGQCGSSPSLVFDAQDRPLIAYRCEVLVDGVLDTQVHFATRNSAP